MAPMKQAASEFLSKKRTAATEESRTPQGLGTMKKAIAFAAALAGLSVLARRIRPKMQNIDWAKRFEAMPDNAPPKWMFHNINVIRENTDRILELLESDRSRATQEASLPSGD